MSNIQDLIHKTSMDCIDKGRSMERERIVNLLTKWGTPKITPNCEIPIWLAVELILAEPNE